MTNTTGLVAAPFTPLNSAGAVDLSVVRKYAAWLKKNEVKGVFVNGTTGEGLSLTLGERIQLVEKWLETADSGTRIFVHVSHNSIRIAREMARHAEKTKCFAIATLPPLFFKPVNVKQLLAYCQEVASAAPNTPFYYYHIPSMTGVHLSMIDFMESAIKEIPTFRGIKYTFENLMDFGLCLSLGEKKYDILFGRDEMLLAGLATGATGAIGSFYNFLGAFANQLIIDFREKKIERAQEKQEFLRQFTRVVIRNGGSISVLKSIMRISGIDCGPVRQPLQNLSQAQEQTLKAELEQICFFNQILKE